MEYCSVKIRNCDSNRCSRGRDILICSPAPKKIHDPTIPIMQHNEASLVWFGLVWLMPTSFSVNNTHILYSLFTEDWKLWLRLLFHYIVWDVMRQRGRYQTSEKRTQTDAGPASPGRKIKKGDWWLFSQMFCCPRRSPRWRWQRHSGIGCGRAWQASEASVLFLPGRPGTASQPATLQQPPN